VTKKKPEKKKEMYLKKKVKVPFLFFLGKENRKFSLGKVQRVVVETRTSETVTSLQTARYKNELMKEKQPKSKCIYLS
jgi:hypothetical protein